MGGLVLAVVALFWAQVNLVFVFVWNCFLQPLGKQTDQQGRLNRFYQGQADSESLVFPPPHEAPVYSGKGILT